MSILIHLCLPMHTDQTIVPIPSSKITDILLAFDVLCYGNDLKASVIIVLQNCRKPAASSQQQNQLNVWI